MTTHGLFCLLFCLIQVSFAVWPKPQLQSTSGKFFNLDRSKFSFSSNIPTNDILNQAFARYGSLIFQSSGFPVPSSKPLITSFQVIVSNPDGPLDTETSENYTLSISAPVSVLKADTEYGALRGLETFSQLVSFQNGQFLVQEALVVDFPRFKYRGVLFDSARHFIPVPVILQHLDAMAYSKFNVMHWHIVDDVSFPYVSTTFPNLAAAGAYRPTFNHVYTPQDIQKIISYAKYRGIRLIPEFDTPAHAVSWALGYPQLATVCFENGKPIPGQIGPMYPISQYTYDFLTSFFSEIGTVFPDAYIHLGGDELDFTCWASNPNITAFMKAKGWGTQYQLLEQFYEQNVVDIVKSIKKKAVVWQDVFDNGVTLDPATTISVWRSPWQDTASAVTAAGFQTTLYAPWYLNYISYGDDWRGYYEVDPLNFTGTPAQKEKLVGGACSFWAEFIDSTNLLSRAWPRAASIGERLWSSQDTTNQTDAAIRLDEFRCMLIRRGIPAEPPLIATPCPQEWTPTYIPPWEQ